MNAFFLSGQSPNELANQFDEYISLFFNGGSLKDIFAAEVFIESGKRPIKDDGASLIHDAAKSLVFTHREGYSEFRTEQRKSFYWTTANFDYLAKAIAENSGSSKETVAGLLNLYREEIFEHEAFSKNLEGFVNLSEHPMVTFIYWLDYLEDIKDPGERKALFQLKHKMASLIRVGKAFIPRDEWQTSITKN